MKKVLNMDEELKSKVEEYAKLFYSAREISVILNLPLRQLLDKESELGKVYFLAGLAADMTRRQNLIDLAETGTPTAMSELRNLIIERNIQDGLS